MTTQHDLDAMALEDLVDLGERVQKKINEKISAEKTDLEKRQAVLAKLEGRVNGKRPVKATRTKGEGAAGKPSTEKGAKDNGAGEPGSGAAASAGNGAEAVTADA